MGEYVVSISAPGVPVCRRCRDPRTEHEWDIDLQRWTRCEHRPCGCREYLEDQPRPEVAR